MALATCQPPQAKLVERKTHRRQRTWPTESYEVSRWPSKDDPVPDPVTPAGLRGAPKAAGAQEH